MSKSTRSSFDIYDTRDRASAERRSTSRKNYLFLDMDGVVVIQGVVRDDLFARLREIVRATSALIVLSSDWRRLVGDRLLAVGHLSRNQLEMHDYTPAMPGACVRPKEIVKWLRCFAYSHRDVNFVAIDDRPLLQEDGGDLLISHFVHTHPLIGIDDSAVRKANAILNGPSLSSEWWSSTFDPPMGSLSPWARNTDTLHSTERLKQRLVDERFSTRPRSAGPRSTSRDSSPEKTYEPLHTLDTIRASLLALRSELGMDQSQGSFDRSRPIDAVLRTPPPRTVRHEGFLSTSTRSFRPSTSSTLSPPRTNPSIDRTGGFSLNTSSPTRTVPLTDWNTYRYGSSSNGSQYSSPVSTYKYR
jgi:hypothetical protein